MFESHILAEATPLRRDGYTALRNRGIKVLRAGDLAAAQELFEQALALARDSGDDRLTDRAFCNLAAVVVETPRRAGVLPELRRILVGNRDAENCRLAAYHIARSYELAKENKKGLFYARIARDLSIRLERSEWIASSHNQMGNLLLADSYFDEACGEFELALGLLPNDPHVLRALILDNLGYCSLVRGRYRDGFRSAMASVRMMRDVGARLWLAAPHLTLSFGYLEIGRLRSAARHGAMALKLAREVGDETSVKNALYLLGETANLSGEPDSAYRHFETLQRRFFPDETYLADFLLAVDVRRLINLKA